MRKIEELKVIIANEFASVNKAYDLNVVCKKYGIMPDEGLDPMKSKRIYVGNVLNKMQDDEIWKLARLIVKEFNSKELIKKNRALFRRLRISVFICDEKAHY